MLRFERPHRIPRATDLFGDSFHLFRFHFGNLHAEGQYLLYFPLFFWLKMLAFFITRFFIRRVRTFFANFVELFRWHLLFRFRLSSAAVRSIRFF